jgi:hypothetical protein
MVVAVLFGEQESTEQVNCIVSSMHQAGPLYPQLLTYRCGAANGRFGQARTPATQITKVPGNNDSWADARDMLAELPTGRAEIPLIAMGSIGVIG